MASRLAAAAAGSQASAPVKRVRNAAVDDLWVHSWPRYASPLAVL
jgi:hypothetical protein